MSRPMSDLERSLLFPDPRKLNDKVLAEMKAQRCRECGGLTGCHAGKMDKACCCPKPDAIPEKKIRYPYLPIPSFNFEPYKPLFHDEKPPRVTEPTEAERLNEGLSLVLLNEVGVHK